MCVQSWAEHAQTWSLEWTAPPEDVGPVTFYAAGNAADKFRKSFLNALCT